MRQAAWQGDKDKRDARHVYLSIALAALIHLGLFTLFQSQNTKPLDAEYQVVKVAIISPPALAANPVILQPPASEEAPIIVPPALDPIPEPEAPGPEPELLLEPQIETQPEPFVEPELPVKAPSSAVEPSASAPDIRPPDGTAQTLQASPAPDGDILIPDRWRLPDGARIPLGNTRQAPNPNLKALATSIDCLGFDADCADLRKDVFAEEQLNETDLVWMPSYAHSGLSDSSLYGLSEAEIRERLGIPTAGVNGVFIPFTNIGFDGGWWDRLHGVNKTCKLSAVIGQNGKAEIRKVCPELRGGAGSIPLYRTGNEFKRNSVD